jgi:hypothetical protein
MKYNRLRLFVAFLMLVIIAAHTTSGQVDQMAVPVQEKIDIASQELQKKALEHIQGGNLTQEHLSQDLNATKKELIQQAKEQLNKNLPINQEQLQEQAKEELRKQTTEKIQSPGFGLPLAISGIIGLAILLRRKP